MVRLILKPEVVEKIKDDAELYGKVAKSIGIGAPSLRAVLRVNHPKLTQAGALRIIREYLKVEQDSDLLCELQEPGITINKTVKATA